MDQVCWEYVSEQPGVVESRWVFLVETLALSVPFLLVGATREPQVYLDTAHLDLGDVLVGQNQTHTPDPRTQTEPAIQLYVQYLWWTLKVQG